MPAQPNPSPKSSLAFAKIVANPTETAWSQVYNAGTLFAVLSLSQEKPEEEFSLHAIGKKIVNNLEAEFFTLEEKSLESIKEAINKSLHDIPEPVSLSLCLAFFKETVLYVFISGAGKILMKREEKIGTILEKIDNSPGLISASGYVHNGDILLLQTAQFAACLSEKDIQQALDLALPSDIAETLSPQIHKKEEGGAAAVIVSFQGATHKPLPPTPELQEETDDIAKEDLIIHAPAHREKRRFSLPALPALPALPKLSFLPLSHLSHRKKIFASIVVVLILLLVGSIIFTKQKQQNVKTQALFQQVYNPAKQNYDDGIALVKLNAGMSHDDFAKADQVIKANLDKFPPNSSERTQLEQLLSQVDAQLAGTPAATNLDTAHVESSDMLAIEKSTEGLSFSQDDKTVYILTQKAVTGVDKGNGKKGDIITNNQDWQDGRAVAPYQGNMYVLDAKNGVVKYVAGSVGFEKTTYFKGQTPDLSKAQAMAIDSSIWILLKDGTILKYTRGTADNYTVHGLDKPMSNAIKIYTDIDTTSVYVLDAGNSRIVKLGKDGTFQTQYTATQLRDAKDFEVQEANKKILILSEGKIWELPL